MATAPEQQQQLPPLEIPELTTEQEIIEHYNKYRGEQSTLMSQIAQAEGERHEHGLVLDALKPLEPERKAHRLVGGVLVERTVAEVTPMIEDSVLHLDKLLKNLSVALQRKENQMNSFMVKYKIQAKGDQNKVEAKEGNAKSVLA